MSTPLSHLSEISDVIRRLPAPSELVQMADPACGGALLHASDTEVHWSHRGGVVAACVVKTRTYAPGQGGRQRGDRHIVQLRTDLRLDGHTVEASAALTVQQAREIAAQLLIQAAAAEASLISEGVAP